MATVTIQTKNKVKRLQVAGSFGREPVLEELTITQGGNYTPSEGTDGFSTVNVDIPTAEEASF